MEDAANLRRQAERSLRLAKAVSDEQASDALTVHAAELLERAAALETEAAHTVQFSPNSSLPPSSSNKSTPERRRVGRPASTKLSERF
jgi:hypothetical protein